jgi:O-antigen ligase
MLATYLGFFWLVVVSVRSRKEQRALVWVVVGTAVFLCVIGLLKRFDILVFHWWDYRAELGRKSHGAWVYVNKNHMAGFLEMAIPMMLGMFLTRSRSPEARIGMICLAMFLVVCQALTLSRGGWTGTAVAMLFMAVVLLLKKGFVHKRLVGTLLGAVVVIGMIIMASTPVVQRITTLTQGELEDELEGRRNIWAGTRAMIQDNLAAGTGPGTYAIAFSPASKAAAARPRASPWAPWPPWWPFSSTATPTATSRSPPTPSCSRPSPPPASAKFRRGVRPALL